MNFTAIALSGDQLAFCANGILYVFTPSQGVIRVICGPDMLPISSRVVNVAWLGEDVVFCGINIPKPVRERISRNKKAKMRAWSRRYGKCVRQ